MLIRQYTMQIDSNGHEDKRPFIIQNAVSSCGSGNGRNRPGPAELAAPGLLIYLEGKSLEERGALEYLRYNFPEELPKEIVDAICGRPSKWKVVRCIPDVDEIMFVVAEPGRMESAWRDSNRMIFGLDKLMSNGYGWIGLRWKFDEDMEVSSLQDGKEKRYVMSKPSNGAQKFRLYEYEKGQLRRENTVKDSNGIYIIDVTEYI